MCDKIPSPFCTCKDYLLPTYEHCHPFMCHNASICKLRRMLDEKISADCYEQHTFYLFDYIKFCKNGFYITDLVHLSRVLELLADKIDSVEVYRPYFKKLLDIAAMPPVMHNCGEELSEVRNLCEYMSVLGFLVIWLHDIKLRYRTYNAIMKLITTKEATKAAVKLSVRFKAVENSHLPEIFTQLVELTSNEEYYEILNIVLTLTKISSVICHKMVLVSAIDYLLIRLVPDEENINPEILKNLTHSENYLKIFDVTCQILINLVANITDMDEETLIKVTPTANSLWAIRYIFRGLLHGKYSQLARNNLMAFILICLDTFPYIEITECHLLDDLAVLSVATEIDNNIWVNDLHFTNSEHDVYFKKMLVLTLSYARKYPNFHLIFEYRNVVPGLIKILTSEYITDWHSEERETLMQYTLLSLYYIAPQLVNIFVENGGIQSLLIIIESYVLLTNDCHQMKLEASLKILSKLVETKNEGVLKTIRAYFGISILNLLCERVLKKEIITSNHQELVSYSFHILSYLYKRPIIKDPSLALVVKYLTRIVKPNFSDSCLNPRTVISAVCLLWEIIMTDNKRLREFIKMEGVFLLLDIIDNNSFPVKIVGLGCLVDVCEDSLCVPFLLTWRGGESKKIIFSSLLASIFREECKKIGTRLTSDDIVTDIHYPLMGENQYREIVLLEKDCQSNSAIADMLGSSRPKIYALLQLLNTRYKENVELINEHYKISNIPIPKNDKIILHLAQNYFALKLSEAWLEVSQDLLISNIDPIEIDAHMLTVLTEQMQKWNKSVKNEQEAILKSEIQKEISVEMELYDNLKKCRLQDAIEALKELKCLARTTDRMFRLAHKKKQKDEIERSLKEIGNIDEIERTYKNDLIATTVIPLKYNVQYNLKKTSKDVNRRNQ